MDVDPPVVAPKRGQVVVRIGDVVASAAIPDFEIDDVTTATVDEMVPIRFALWKAGNHPRPEHFLPGLGDQSRLAFEHHHELIFERVPMAQGRGGEGAAQMLGIGRAAPRLNRRRVENRKWPGI